MTNDLFSGPLVKTEPEAVPEPSAFGLLRTAVEQGADVGTLERLSALVKDIRREEAQAALVNALNVFQANCPVIEKRRPVYTNSGDHMFNFAGLADIRQQIRPLLDELGLSTTFSVTDDGSHVVCTVQHRDGASTSSQFPIRIDGKLKVNDTQRMGAAVTFARRYALTGALGIDTEDTDGIPELDNPNGNPNAPKAQPRGDRVSAEQLTELFAEWQTANGGGGTKHEFVEWAAELCGTELKDGNAWNQQHVAKCYAKLGEIMS